MENLRERQHPVGRALTAEEQTRLFAAAASNQEWEHAYCVAIVAANTSMRPVEVKHLRRCDVDLVRKLLFVRRSKNESSHRVIPLNVSALNALARMFERADMLGPHRARGLSVAGVSVGTLRCHEADAEVGHRLASPS
jgi:integrase